MKKVIVFFTLGFFAFGGVSLVPLVLAANTPGASPTVQAPVKGQGEGAKLRQEIESLEQQAKPLRAQLEPIEAQAKPLREQIKKIEEQAKPIREQLRPIQEKIKADREKLRHLREERREERQDHREQMQKQEGPAATSQQK